MTITTYPHIEKLENQPARLQRIPRVRVAQIAMDYLAYGWSVEEMCRQHPYLSLSEAHAAMAYYFDNQDEIDREIRAELEQLNKNCDFWESIKRFREEYNVEAADINPSEIWDRKSTNS